MNDLLKLRNKLFVRKNEISLALKDCDGGLLQKYERAMMHVNKQLLSVELLIYSRAINS